MHSQPTFTLEEAMTRSLLLAIATTGMALGSGCFFFPAGADSGAGGDAGSGPATGGGGDAGALDSNSVESGPVDSGTPIAAGEQPPRVAVDSTSIYWTTIDGLVMKLQKGSDTPTM